MGRVTGFKRDEYSVIHDRVRSDLVSEVEGADSVADQGPLAGVSFLISRSEFDLQSHLSYVARSAMPLFAVGLGLDDWGAVFGIPRIGELRASGSVVISGAEGSSIDDKSTFKSKSGSLYRVVGSFEIIAGASEVDVISNEPGELGNLPVGAELRLVSPVPGLNSVSLAGPNGIRGGVDREEDGRPGVLEHYRGRVVERIQHPPAGGNKYDYIRWAQSVPGVTKAWCFPEGMGPGTVVILFMMDKLRADFEGVPQGDDGPLYSGDLKDVYDYVTGGFDRTNATTGANVFIFKPPRRKINITISGLLPLNLTVKQAIEKELADLMLRKREPGINFSLSWIREAISVSVGERRHKLLSPSDDIQLGTYEIPALGDISYA